jgi:hypothetical protein
VVGKDVLLYLAAFSLSTLVLLPILLTLLFMLLLPLLPLLLLPDIAVVEGIASEAAILGDGLMPLPCLSPSKEVVCRTWPTGSSEGTSPLDRDSM